MAAIAAGLVVLASCAAGCGGRVVFDEEAGHAGDSSGAGAAGDAGAGTCPDTSPPPSPTQPTQPGCYTNDGSGWVQVPCECELWLKNPTPSPAKVQIELTMMPAATQPTLTGPLDVEMAFDDADSSWYAVWVKQAGSGSAFAVTTEGGKTTVRMGTSSVVLAPVALSACQLRDAMATVNGSFPAMLTMQATLSDGGGNAIATMNGSCNEIPPL